MSKKSKSTPKNSLFTAGIVSFVFDLLKQMLKNFENSRGVKKADKMDEQFSTIEHLIIKLENQINENRKEVERLKNRILVSDVITVGLLIFILIEVIR